MMTEFENPPQSPTPTLTSDFQRFLEAQDLAASTIRAYLRDAAAFERWERSLKPKRRRIKPKATRSARRREELPPTSRDLTLGFLDSLKKPPSPSYRNRLLAALRQLFKYREAAEARRGDMMPVELFSVRDVKRTRVRTKAATPLPRAELHNLTQVTLETSRPTERVRNLGLILFLYGTGLTVTELCALKLKNIYSQADEPQAITIATRERCQVLPLSAAAQRALHLWLDQRSQLNVAGDALWVTLSRNRHKNKGDPLSPRGVQALLKHYGETAKLGVTLTPHVLRQTFKHELEQVGVEKRVVQALLGYKRPGEAPSLAELQEAVALLPDPVARTST